MQQMTLRGVRGMVVTCRLPWSHVQRKIPQRVSYQAVTKEDQIQGSNKGRLSISLLEGDKCLLDTLPSPQDCKSSYFT